MVRLDRNPNHLSSSFVEPFPHTSLLYNPETVLNHVTVTNCLHGGRWIVCTVTSSCLIQLCLETRNEGSRKSEFAVFLSLYWQVAPVTTS